MQFPASAVDPNPKRKHLIQEEVEADQPWKCYLAFLRRADALVAAL